jgi:phosphohistidine swiveling domain-containing protein
MTKDYSTKTVKDIEKEIEEILELLPENQRSDLFRVAVLTGQMELAKFIYHDKKHNPITRFRSGKSKKAETVAFSQALVQLLLLMKVRDIDFPATFEHAIAHMKRLDFMRREPKNGDEVSGHPISGGKVSGKAYVVDDENPPEDAPKDSVVVMEHAEPGVAELLLDRKAVVTDQGSRLCHMAILARENNFPAIVGTGNATRLIRTGDEIIVDADTGKVFFQKK